MTVTARAYADEQTVTRDRVCSVCGYGIATRTRPERCPMCQKGADWVRAERLVWAADGFISTAA